MPDAAQRASDREREAVAEHLRVVASEGRLDANELEQRLDAAYAARTSGQLELLTRDLPAPPTSTLTPPMRSRSARFERLRRQSAWFVTINLTCIAVWVATGSPGYNFWPELVLLATGVVLLSTAVRTLLGVEHDRDFERQRRLSGAARRPW